MHLRQAALATVRIGVGVLFVIAGVVKGAALSDFRDEISRYALLPSSVVPIAAVLLVALEIVCGLSMIVDRGSRRSAWLLAALVSLFLFALTSRMVRGDTGECGCFGGSFAEPIGPGVLVRDTVLLLCCILFAIRRSEPASVNRPRARYEQLFPGMSMLSLQRRVANTLQRVPRWLVTVRAHRKYPLVRQYDRADCGPAALLTVLKTLGGDAPFPHVRRLCGTGATGSSMRDLLVAAGELGLEARGATGDYDSLRKEPMPCIAQASMAESFLPHFVVLYRVCCGSHRRRSCERPPPALAGGVCVDLEIQSRPPPFAEIPCRHPPGESPSLPGSFHISEGAGRGWSRRCSWESSRHSSGSLPPRVSSDCPRPTDPRYGLAASSSWRSSSA